MAAKPTNVDNAIINMTYFYGDILMLAYQIRDIAFKMLHGHSLRIWMAPIVYCERFDDIILLQFVCAFPSGSNYYFMHPAISHKLYDWNKKIKK